MNARQKAKKYKSMYLDLLVDPLRQEAKMWKRKYYAAINEPGRGRGYKIDTWKVEHFYPEELFDKDHIESFYENIYKNFIEDIENNIKDYVKYIVGYDPYLKRYHIRAELRIVNFKEEP